MKRRFQIALAVLLPLILLLGVFESRRRSPLLGKYPGRIILSADGSTLISTNVRDGTRVWSLKSRRHFNNFSYLRAESLSPDGWFFTTDYNIQSVGSSYYKFNASSIPVLYGFINQAWSGRVLVFLVQPEFVFPKKNQSRYAVPHLQWVNERGKMLQRVSLQNAVAARKDSRLITAFSSDGRLLVIGQSTLVSGESILLFDTQTGQLKKQLSVPPFPKQYQFVIEELKFSHDGQLVWAECYVNGHQTPAQLHMWDVRTGKSINENSRWFKRDWPQPFPQTDHVLLDKEWKLLNVRTGEKKSVPFRRPFHGDRAFNQILFSVDGKVMAVSDGTPGYIWVEKLD